jgi:hypothetical protein
MRWLIIYLLAMAVIWLFIKEHQLAARPDGGRDDRVRMF